MTGIQVSSQRCSGYDTKWRKWLVLTKGNFLTLPFEGVNYVYYPLTGWRVGVLSCCVKCYVLRWQPGPQAGLSAAASRAAGAQGTHRQQHPSVRVQRDPRELRARRQGLMFAGSAEEPTVEVLGCVCEMNLAGCCQTHCADTTGKF